MLEKTEQLNALLKILDDNQAVDVVVIDVSEQTSVTDFMVIAGGRSSRHTKAIANYVLEGMKAKGFEMLGVHGMEAGDWVLVDFGDFVLHLMQADSRAFYNLEGLWQEKSTKSD